MSSSAARNPRLIRLVAIVAGIVGVLGAVLVPLLPVAQHTSSFGWPAGQQLSPENPSVVAPLTAEVPRSLDATIPCSLISDLPASGGTLLTTIPTASSADTGRALIVSASADTVSVNFRGETAVSAPRADVASARCTTLRIWTTNTDVGAQFVGLGAPGTLSPDYRPQISGIFTTLPTATVNDAIGKGLRVNVEIDDRFDSSPSALKMAVMILTALAALIAVIALGMLDRIYGYHRQIGRVRFSRLLRPRLSDTAVAATLLVWQFLGSGAADDGYILNMGRNADQSGYLANYYRFYGVTEAPFDWYYSFLAQWGSISHANIWMHVPTLLAGLASWLILSRVLLPRLGAGVRRSGWAVWAAAAVFMVFWIPLCSGLRSESIIVLGSLLTWWAVELAISTRRMVPAAVAGFLGALTLALAPQGLVAVAVLIVASRALLRILIARRREAGLLALIAPIAAAGAVVLVVVFRDQTLATVYEAVRVKMAVGPTLSWYQDFLRFYFLTVPTPDGSLARRIPVLLLIASLLVTLAIMLRRGRIAAVDPAPTWRLVGATFITLLLLSFTPTKWTIQFGVYAGLGAALAAVATVGIADASARSARNLSVFASGLVFACAAASAGKNAWPWAYNLGISWFDKAPVVAGVQISTLLLILGVGLAMLAVWQHLRLDYARDTGLVHDDQHTLTRADRLRLAGAASPIAVIAALMVVAELLVFVKAVAVREPAYTVAQGNVDALRGNTCGMANSVLVEPDANRGMLQPVDGKNASQALAGESPVGFTPNGVADDLTPEQGSQKPGWQNTAAQLYKTFIVAGGLPGTTGGQGPKTVNGSTDALPFGLNPATTPVLGSFGYTGGEANLTTDWYQLPQRNSSRLLVISTAGAIESYDQDGVGQFGQKLKVEFGRNENGQFVAVGNPFTPINPGPDRSTRPWRNLRIPMEHIPPRATAMRIVARDNNLNPNQWLAITPPRAPQLQTLQQVVGDQDPTLVDFSVGSQFPCQNIISMTNGTVALPKWRILPDRVTAMALSKTWMGISGGGLLSVYETLTNPNTVATYLTDDWFSEWGSLEKLTPYVPQAVPAQLNTGQATRWGWNRDGSMRVVSQDK